LDQGAPGAALVSYCYVFGIMESHLSGGLADTEDKPQWTRPMPAAVPAAAGCFWAMPHGPPIEMKKVSAASLGL
jgi:hypothetical protein